MLGNLPPWLQKLFVPILLIFLGASATAVIATLKPSPGSVKLPVLVQSGKTGKPLKNVTGAVLVSNGSPVPFKTDDAGYAELRITSQDAVQIQIEQLGYIPTRETLNASNLGQLHSITLNIDEKAPACFGDSCTDRIPAAAKCDKDADTINYATGEQFSQGGDKSNTIRIELRNSQNCNARWAKVIAPPSSYVYLQDDQSSKYSDYRIPTDDLPDHHTEMISGDLRSRACVQSSQGSRAVTCTGFIN